MPAVVDWLLLSLARRADGSAAAGAPSLLCVSWRASLLRGGKGGKSMKRGPQKTMSVTARTRMEPASKGSGASAAAVRLPVLLVVASMVLVVVCEVE